MEKSFVRRSTLFLFALSFILYANTLNHGYVLDDFSVIKENFVVKQGTSGIGTIFKTHYRHGYGYTSANLYRPLALSLFALQWEIAPDQPALAHWFNVILFALNVILLFYLLLKLIGPTYRYLILLAVALFGAHPIHTEVVANIKSADELLASGFAFASMILLLKFIDLQQKKWLWISLSLFFLAFLSKESTVTFLALIPFALLLFRSFSIQKALKTVLWYLIPFCLFIMMRIKVLGSLGGDKTIAKIDNLLMAAPNGLIKLATAIKILGLYLWKLILPHPLMNDYSIDQISLTSFSDWKVWLALLVYGTLITLVIQLWKKKPIVAFGIGFYLFSIALYSNVFYTIGTSFGERLLYLPSVGFCLLVAYLLFYLSKSSLTAIKMNMVKVPMVIGAIIILLYGFKTIDRNAAWSDNYTLYATDVENCDRSARCHYYYGLGLMRERVVKEKDPAKKNQLLIESIDAFSNSLTILPTYSDAYGQRGLAYYRLNRLDEALKDYKMSLQYSPNNATTLSNMGSLYFEKQDYQNAKIAFERAIRANPTFVDALANYASTLGTLGEFNSAITYFKKAIALKPNEPSYYQMVGMTYKNLGNQQQANVYLNKAAQLRR